MAFMTPRQRRSVGQAGWKASSEALLAKDDQQMIQGARILASPLSGCRAIFEMFSEI
ncbi:hypothetical protein [Humitalea rosea]|uniref:hypothetical protein n=1 Tax=Humitalea rosea TaxID=990373 RepID=UPI00131449A2|nr:hypothetical protein [Humitalea rosea]